MHHLNQSIDNIRSIKVEIKGIWVISFKRKSIWNFVKNTSDEFVHMFGSSFLKKEQKSWESAPLKSTYL